MLDNRRFIAGFLAVVISVFNCVPSFAILDFNKNKKEDNKTESLMEYVNMDWWKEFQDPILEEYIVKALENNHDLKIATIKTEQARQNVKMQLASELPMVGVGALPGLGKMSGERSTQGVFALPIIASYEVDLFLKNHDKTKSIRKVYETSKLNEKATYISIVGAVGATYYNLVKLDKIIALQENIIKDKEQIYELMKKRNEKGLTSTSDLVQAQKAYILSTSELVDLKKAQEELLTRLAILVGESPENISTLKRCSYDELATRKVIPTEVASDIIFSRPDCQAAEKMLEKAGIDVRVAKKEFLPTFNIGALLMPFTTSAMNSMSWTTAIAGAGAGALLPVFTGGRRIAVLKYQKAKYDEMIQTFQKTNLVAVKEVSDSLTNLKLDNEKYLNNLNAFNMEQSDFEIMEKRYEQGIVSNLNLIQKRELLNSTEKLKVSSDIDEYIAQISLYKAVAGSNI